MIVFAIGSNNLFAQNESIAISGQIIEESSQEPIPYATVLIVDIKSNEYINGTTTNEDGNIL